MSVMSPSSWWTRVRVYLSARPDDVVVGVAYLAVATSVLVAVADLRILRSLVGLPLLLFVPGYAAVSALFPGRRENVTEDSAESAGLDPRRSGGIDRVERIALSFGLSVAIVPLVTGMVSVLGVDPSVRSLSTALVLPSAIGLLIGDVRRRRLPPERRFDPSLPELLRQAKAAHLDAPGRYETAVNVTLALSILLVTTAFGFALLSPAAGTPTTNMLLLTENETGSYVAAGFPQELSPNESAELVVGIENDERDAVEYTVVALHQRVTPGDTSVSVQESRELERLRQTVPADQTGYVHHRASPAFTGEDTRLTYLLYKDEAPDDPSVESSYRHTYLWVDVADS